MEELKFISKVEDEYLYLYQDNRELINRDVPDYIRKIRDNAIEDFRESGIPEHGSENYTHIDLPSIFSNTYKKIFSHERYDVNLNEVFQCNVPELDTHLVLLINGNYYSDNKPIAGEADGIIVCGLAEAMVKYPGITAKHLSKYTSGDSSGLASLNTAFAQDGLFVYLPKGKSLKKAIQVVNLLRANENRMIQQRNLIILEENCSANIVICDHTLSEHHYLCNNVTEVFAGKNSVFDLYNMQDEHNHAKKVNSVFIHQEYGSNVLTNTITLHGGIVRNNIWVNMDEECCENHTYGIFFADKNQHIDNFSAISHNKPNCTSNELIKGILDDNSTGAFAGRILVARGAQKTLAYQSNNNILLTDMARMNTKPQLEIYADDVKCSHGATVGQLDENAMFYLRSRGINKKEARMLLM
ncbi:MAG: Fe-S cluster assembly protein SufD, partial [Bacteroidota bacterium]